MNSVYKISTGLLLLTMLFFTYCKKDDSSTSSGATEIPWYVLQSDTIIEVYDTVVSLKGQAVGTGITSKWSLDPTSPSTGTIIDATDPQTKFSGKLRNTYVLRYEMHKGTEVKSQLVTVKFVVPTIVKDTVLEAYETDDVDDNVVTLNGIAMHSGLICTWTILSSNGSPSIDEIHNPNGKMTGTMGESYRVKLSVTARDGSWATPLEKQVLVKFNKFTDTRDNEKYRVVTMGTQLWMAQNLRYKDNSGVYFDVDAYNGSEYLRKRFGCLYSYPEAVKAVPSGWRMPDTTDWMQLDNYVKSQTVYDSNGKEVVGTAKKLKATYGWTIDSLGNDGNGLGYGEFDVLPGGMIIPGYLERYYIGMGTHAIYWSVNPRVRKNFYSNTMRTFLKSYYYYTFMNNYDVLGYSYFVSSATRPQVGDLNLSYFYYSNTPIDPKLQGYCFALRCVKDL